MPQTIPDLGALGNGAEAVTLQVHSVTTISNVVIDVDVADGMHTLVVTRIPSGDQLRFPMDAFYAARVRGAWQAASDRTQGDVPAEKPKTPRKKKT